MISVLKKREEEGTMNANLGKVDLSSILYESLKVQLMQAISSKEEQRLSRFLWPFRANFRIGKRSNWINKKALIATLARVHNHTDEFFRGASSRSFYLVFQSRFIRRINDHFSPPQSPRGFVETRFVVFDEKSKRSLIVSIGSESLWSSIGR